MNKYERLALAMQVHMKLLRVTRRNTDIDWLAQDVSYIREIQRVCHAHGSSEMRQWADRLEEAALSIQSHAGEPASPSTAHIDPTALKDFEDTTPMEANH